MIRPLAAGTRFATDARLGSRIVRAAGLVCMAAAVTLAAHAQGVLTVTPGNTVSTAAGSGAIGNTGDGGAATSAALKPAAVVRDAAGNLYIADSRAHVVRRVTTTGTITTVAGTGIAGFSGDGGAATAAQLDTPTGLAIDASGNLYIADSHNQRVRKITGATITTVAGTGSAGFSGDGSAATAATLRNPTAVAVDASGNLYIADTNNHRVRKVAGGTITTLAGTGEQAFNGDGGAANAAALDSPTGVAVDSNGIVYIADRNNLRIRSVSFSGIITTLAGNGAGGYNGTFSGDGANATAVALAKPTGVTVTADGRIFIADTNNQRVRQVGNGGIATVTGTGAQGFAGDNGAATAATLDSPRALAPDASGNLYLADTNNLRVRLQMQPAITFSAAAVGTTSAPEPVTLGNTGTAALTITQLAVPKGFTRVSGGSCSATPITLNAGANCTVNLAYTPTAAGPATGTLTIGGTGVPPQTVLLNGGAANVTNTVLALTSSMPNPFVGQQVTLTATVQTANGVAPATGTVTFSINGASVVSASLSGGVATANVSFPAAGTYTASAAYNGDTNYTAATASLLESAVDFTLTATSGPSGVVAAGTSATYALALQSNATFPYPVHLSVSGLPTGATATFIPSDMNLTAANKAVSSTLTVQLPALAASLRHSVEAPLAMAIFAFPFALGLRRRTRRGSAYSIIFLVGAITTGSLAGCGSGIKPGAGTNNTYNLIITATANNTTNTSITLVHTVNVSLTVRTPFQP